MKVSLSLVGNYMCKNPPVVLFDVTGLHSDKDLIKKYIFNTPADIQRNFQAQFVRLNGSQTIMYTKFSHDVLTGLVNLVLTLYDNQKRTRFMWFKLYGTQKHYNYFQMAKFHLGEKILGISYCSWLKQKLYRLGIVDEALYQQILKSDKFSSFIWKINWRLEKQPKQKINNSCQHLREDAKYYQDQYVIIKPFLQKNPAIERQLYYNSVTHYLCVWKTGQEKQNNDNNHVHRLKATLILTYQSVQQLKKVLSRTDIEENINNNMGLLDFVESNLKNGLVQLSTIVHIVQNYELVSCPQFYQLYTILDNMCYKNNSFSSSLKKQQIKVSHLFYGYGIKSSTTNIHHFLNTYYKGIRFYSICSKLFKYIPNITLNHYTFWNKLFEKDFVNVVSRIEQKSLNENRSFVEVYKPMHLLKINQTKSSQNHKKTDISNQQKYKLSQQLLSSLKYPLFSTASQYRPTQQLTQIYQKKSSYLGYNLKKSKNKKLLTLDKNIKLFKQFDPKVIFLGTNSKTPSELRNVSGILVQLPKYSASETLILLDCGSGTYEQFMYHYSPQEMPQKLIGLKVIFMTHLHADHNLGILDLINQRNKLIKQKNLQLSQNKLFLILPFNMFGWIDNYCKTVTNILQGCEILFTQTLIGQKINVRDQFFEKKRCQVNFQRLKLSPGRMFGSKSTSSTQKEAYTFQQNDHYNKYIKRDSSLQDYVKTFSQVDDRFVTTLLQKHGFKQQFVKDEFYSMLQKQKIKKFLPSKVFHCPFSYGVIIEHNNGIKISYSGDCRPTPQFLQEAKDSMLLIHEATYGSNNQLKAQYKLHSTFHQALQAGLISKSQNTCVTHFTPGPFDRDLAQTSYHSLYKPQVLDYYKKKGIIACDHLEFNLSEMDELVKVSKIIANVGTNNITQKNANPFSMKSIIQQSLKNHQQKKTSQIVDEEDQLD